MSATIHIHPNAAPVPVVQPKGLKRGCPGNVSSLGIHRAQKSMRESEQASIDRALRIPLPAADACNAHGWRLGSYHGLHEIERGIVAAALDLLKARLRTSHVMIDSPDAMRDYLRLQLAPEEKEMFAVAFLDSQNRMIAFEVMFVGSLTQTSVYPRELVRAALAHNAASVILAHNHPSGQATPSKADVLLTQTLRSALGLIDVRVLDHLIVTVERCLSMTQEGLI